MHQFIGIKSKILLVVIIAIVKSSYQYEQIYQQYENEIVTQEWYQTIIGSIKYAKMTYQNGIIIQNFRNQVMKYDFQGNQKWSSKTKKGELIKIQKDWAIVFKQSTNSLIYIELATGKALYEVNYGLFKEELPRMKSSQTLFVMYDSQNIFWVRSNPKQQHEQTNNHSDQTSNSKPNRLEDLTTGKYTTSKNYDILNIQIDKNENAHLLLQYKKSQICLALLEIDEDNETQLKLRRCRQMSYNQRTITYASVNGFIIQNIKDQEDSALRIVYLDSSTAELEESAFSIFSSEEDIYKARETIHQIYTYEQNEIILFRYANYFEVCRLTALDMICPDIFIKKRMYQIIPTYNYQSLLFLSSTYINVPEDSKQIDENELKKELNAQIFDLEQYQVFNFGRITLEENISFVYAKVNMKDPASPSINLIVQTNKHQVIFAQMFQKQQIIYSLLEGSLQNDLPPLFYRFYNTLQNPYPETKNPGQAQNYLSFAESILNQSQLKVANSIIHNILHRWESDIKFYRDYFAQLKFELINQQIVQNDTTENDRIYGFEKIILIPTRNFRLFAFNSASGRLIYKKSIQGQTDKNEVVGLVRLAQERKENNGFYVEDNNDEFIILVNNQEHITLQYIEPKTGEILRTEIVNLPDKDRYSSYMKVKLIPGSKKEFLIFFTSKHNTIFYPNLDLVENNLVNKRLQSHNIFMVRRDYTEILTYQLKDVSSGLQSKSSLPLKQNQKIIKISHNLSQLDLTQFQERLIPIETETKDAYRWLDLENRIFCLLILNEQDKKLTINVIDTVTNKLLFQKYMANVKYNYPIDMYLHENKLYVSFFSEYYEKQIIFEMKIYFRYFLTLFSLPNPELPIDSIACDVKTLFSEQSVRKMYSVVLNNLIFTNHNNDIMYVNLQRFNETDTTLVNSTFTQINTNPLSSIQNIYIDKTSLTSRYLLFANGAQIYSVNFTPEGRFDTLPLNFNYKTVINSIAITFTLLLLSKCFNQIRTSRKKEKSF